LPPQVSYVQLEDGEKCKAGQRYVRSVNDFLENFTRIDDEKSQIAARALAAAISRNLP